MTDVEVEEVDFTATSSYLKNSEISSASTRIFTPRVMTAAGVETYAFHFNMQPLSLPQATIPTTFANILSRIIVSLMNTGS